MQLLKVSIKSIYFHKWAIFYYKRSIPACNVSNSVYPGQISNPFHTYTGRCMLNRVLHCYTNICCVPSGTEVWLFYQGRAVGVVIRLHCWPAWPLSVGNTDRIEAGFPWTELNSASYLMEPLISLAVKDCSKLTVDKQQIWLKLWNFH